MHVGVRHGAHGGGRKSQKIDFWKFVLYRSWVLSGVTGHLLRPLGVSRALRDHPEPPTGRTSPAPSCLCGEDWGGAMSKIHENLENHKNRFLRFRFSLLLGTPRVPFAASYAL